MNNTFVFDTNALISTQLLNKSKSRKAYDKGLDAIREFQARAALIDVELVISASHDEKDNKFLELAVAANASCIISGDKDLLILNPFRGIPILNAVDFLNNF